MTEEEWLTSTDVRSMLRFLTAEASERRFRLFSVSSCRRFWHYFQDERSRQAIEIAESWVDGLATDLERQDAATVASAASEDVQHAGSVATIPIVVTGQALALVHDEYNGFMCAFLQMLTNSRLAVQESARWEAESLRDIFGNPFEPVTLRPYWLTPTVTNLAQTIYDDRELPSGLFDNQRLGVVADALEEAGCDNTDILEHLRGGGDHVRGCWAVDLILAKE